MPADKQQNGFTLVELAIVMAIIGILLSAVFYAQKMIENARAVSLISQVNGYRTAIATFIDKYDQMPGDTPGATTRISNCTAANFCFNGNDDGLLAADVAAPNTWYLADHSAIANERTQLWRHLFLAGMIGNVSTGNTLAWGESHPAAGTGSGGFSISNGSSPTDTGKYYFRIQRYVTGIPAGGLDQQAMSPYLARVIDAKIDDGVPSSGSVRATDLLATDLCEDSAGQEYMALNTRNCLMFIEVGSKF